MPRGTVGEGKGRRTAALPLVGRTAEWSRLVDDLAAASAGRCRIVLIEGEAGIGKSRLVEEVQTEARRAGFRIRAGSADELEQMRPLAAVSDALVSDVEEGHAGAAIRSLLGDTATRGVSDLQLTDAMLDHIEELALEAPVVLVLEDLHWADGATIAAIRLIGRRLAYLPVLVVGTYRPHPVPSGLPRLLDAVSREDGTIICLRPLSTEAVTELSSRILDADVGPGLSRIVGTAAGNPLFVTELVRGLQQGGALRVFDGVGDTDVDTLPATLRLTILRRLSFLPPETIETLRAAAVLGSSFGLEELAALAGRSVAHVVATLGPAIESRVVGEGDTRLRFRHDLIQEAVYNDIPAPVRATMHVGAAKALSSLSLSATRVAQHLLRGAHVATPEVVDLLLDVASKLRFSTPRLAIELNERVVELLGHHDPRVDRLRLQMLMPLAAIGRVHEAITVADQLLTRKHDPSMEAGIRLARIEAKQRDGRTAECIPELEAIANDPRYTDDMQRLARVGLASAYVKTAQAEATRALAEPLVAEAREANDHLSLVGALTCVGGVAVLEGRVAESIRHLKEALELDTHRRTYMAHPHAQLAAALMTADRLEEARMTLSAGRRRELEAGEITSLAAFAHVAALIGFLEGAWDDAVAEAETGLELIADGVGTSTLVMCSYVSLAQISLRRGDPERARRMIADARAVIADKGPALFMDAVGWSEALCLEAAGDIAAATDAAWATWDEAEPYRFTMTWRWICPDLVRFALTSGDRHRAHAVAEAAEEGARRATGVPSAEGVSLRCNGLLADEPDLLLAAIEAYSRGPWVLQQALASEDAAVCLARHSQDGKARELFEAALSVYDDLGAVRESARCAAAMRAAGLRRGSRRRRSRPVVGWASLTPKEREVARMAAEGLTNPQIAERLFVSKYTVMTHLSHVFGKLGISSRVELAAIASREVKEPGLQPDA